LPKSDGNADRLAELDAELTQLRAQQDLAMSAFRFDEANAIQASIAALEDRRRELAAAVPASIPESSAGVVPKLLRPRGARARRIRPAR